MECKLCKCEMNCVEVNDKEICILCYSIINKAHGKMFKTYKERLINNYAEPFTDRDLSFISEWDSILTEREIAIFLGRTKPSINNIRQRRRDKKWVTI